MRPATRSICALAVLAGAQSLPALAGPASLPQTVAQDLHLSAIPRDAAEAARIAAVTAAPEDFSAPEPFEENSGGAATVRARANRDAFSQPSANLAFEDELRFKVGNGLFRKIWVSSPSSTKASDGLGPLYNARACQRCHLKDGRGHPPEGPEDSAVSIFLRVSVPAASDDTLAEEIEGWIADAPEPVYGRQMQDFALPGHAPEYRLAVSWTEEEVTLGGGETATLRRPDWRAEDLGYGPLAEDAMLSPRVAPQMLGLGLLEAIPAAEIIARADPEDADGDGISGRVQVAISSEYGVPMLGRFGLKAGAPTVRQQSADAFTGDIGISNPLHPGGWGECTEAQADCRTAPHGGDPGGVGGGLEVDAEGLDLVTFYSRNLAVPARRNAADSQVLRGKALFHAFACAACHTPKHVTARLEDRPEQSFQLIWPYTDLLLHDMGPGLADGRPEGRANGREWRTPPLWGIGLTEQVSGHSYFLHDGRARSLLEAVLWHGGEAEAARDAVAEADPEDRAALIAFLESL
ncbi:di-heme oxidoredictase family protein [Rhodovulum sp. DZ06]|uniref:di-heme oxidoreductase family protein n=1 Tax=Rhodovulum sp. DZ06 TaxID=3425126 RepID=UPI003D3345CF